MENFKKSSNLNLKPFELGFYYSKQCRCIVAATVPLWGVTAPIGKGCQWYTVTLQASPALY
jgi:hypothetical protein